MSLLYRDSSGNETSIAGLNGLSGELVYGASTIKSGINSNAVGTLDVGYGAIYSVTFDSPMSDTNYIIVLSPTRAETTVSFLPDSKTVNGFQYYLSVNHRVSDVVGVTWAAFELYSAEGLADIEKDISDLQAAQKNNYKHFYQSAYSGSIFKISGFKEASDASWGETFILRQRGGETILLSIGANWQDNTREENYVAFRIGAGHRKITSMQFDYNNRDLYIVMSPRGELYISQINGEVDNLTISSNATIPDSGVYTIDIVDPTDVESIGLTPTGHTSGGSVVAKRNGQVVTVEIDNVKIDDGTDGLSLYSGLPAPAGVAETAYGFASDSADFNKTILVQVASDALRFHGATANHSYYGSIVYITND